MKTAIAIRHVHFEDLGTLEPLLQSRGYQITYVHGPTEDLSRSSISAADLVVVLGGPVGAYEHDSYPFLQAEIELLQSRVRSRRPLVGICLGAQLIARALGCKVYPMSTQEIGFKPLQLTTEGKTSVLAPLAETPVLHWHGDQFDIPPGGKCLASTETCAHQAFAVDRHILGLQFHLETNLSELESWLVGHACELRQAGVKPETLRSQVADLTSALPALSTSVFSRWLDELER
ncbi:MAG: glutamine amidotransferase [Polaromonas sp.]|nr:glutamine amidotransferase [Polaromonas sp.]